MKKMNYELTKEGITKFCLQNGILDIEGFLLKELKSYYKELLYYRNLTLQRQVKKEEKK